MRPTDIGLGNPRAKTPGPYRVQITHCGDYLGPVKRTFLRSGSFGRSRRFDQYREWERRTGPVGPGSYSLFYTPKHGSVRISPPHIQRTGTYVSGNLIVYDPDLDHLRRDWSPVTRKSRKKSHRKDFEDTSIVQATLPDLHRPKTHSQLRRQRTSSAVNSISKSPV